MPDSSNPDSPIPASKRIDQLVDSLADWRGQTLAAVRKAILSADKSIVEQWKWMGSPVWSCEGTLVVGNAHRDKVKLTFAHGANLEDPGKLFNNGFDGKVWRAIDFHKGDPVNSRPLRDLVRAAIAFNRAKPKRKSKA